MFAIEVAEEILVRALSAFAGFAAVLQVFGTASAVPSRQTKLGADSAEGSGLSLTVPAEVVEQSLDSLLVVFPSSLPNLPHLQASSLRGEELSSAYLEAGFAGEPLPASPTW